MDLDSWKPNDKARRLAVAIAIQLAVFVFVAVWQALAWPWYLVVLAPVVAYPLVFTGAYRLLRRVIRN